MNLLLDTCAFIWLIRADKRLSPAARSLFQSPENKVFLSAVSAWEIAVKHYAGKLPLARPAHEYIPMEREKHGIATLDLDETATFELHKLPAIHADPFDRLLICQAITHQMTILTPDPFIHQYPVSVKW